MALSLMAIGPVIFGPKDDLISYLQQKRLLATNKQCPGCAATMVLQCQSDVVDQYRYIITIIHACECQSRVYFEGGGAP